MRNLVSSVKAYAKERYFALLWSLWILLFVEFLSRGDLLQLVGWPVHHFFLFVLNVILACGFLVLLLAVTGHARVSFWVLSAISLALAGVSGIKLRLMGSPLLPWDFMLAGEAGSVVDYRDVARPALLLGIGLFLGVSALLVMRLGRNQRLGLRERAIAGGTALVIIIAACLAPATGAASSDQALHVRTDGFLLSALQNVRTMVASGSQKLDPSVVAAFAGQHRNGDTGSKADVRPNIIVVLSESLWDLTQMKGVTYSADPLAYLHQLEQHYPSGTMRSPEFGGRTANVEFEVLTGLSMRFLQEGNVPYLQWVDHGIDSLASIMTRQGYTATAISPWAHGFFDGDKVYRNLGFSKFISLEFMRRVFSGPNIPDSEVADIIIRASQQSQGPDLIFANTGENHYPYPKDKFEQNTIKVEGPGLSQESKDILETYAQGCSAADQMLRKLVEHYQQSGEPTMILWFGDHLPVLGQDYSVYREGGFITGRDDPNFEQKMHSTPVLVWDNYLPEQKESLNVSPSFLGPYVLNRAKQPGTPFTDLLSDLYKRFPVIPPRAYWAQAGISESDLATYAAIQQDVLKGERQTYGDLKDKIVNPNFLLGWGPITVDEATGEASATDGPVTVTIRGHNFSPRSVAYLDGASLTTTWKDYDTLTATVPHNLVKPGPQELQIKVLDVDGKVLSQSPVTSITLQ